jgi:hypothetical protein
MFRFLVGKEEKPMMIHTALVAKQSPALKSLVSGSMEEAQTKTAIWEDVDEETFGLFAQFVYAGDYTPPPHVVEELTVDPSSSPAASPRTETAEAQEPGREPLAEGIWGNNVQIEAEPRKQDMRFDEWGKSRKKVVGKKGSSPSRSKFHNRTYPLPTPTPATAPRANESSSEDYTPVFLGHARLYVFAEKYDIPPLKTLALHKLHRTLCIFTLYAARHGDIIELARYIYANTPARTVMDPLREMLVQYIAYEATSVARCAQCMELVEENGSFASDLLRMVLERVA